MEIYCPHCENEFESDEWEGKYPSCGGGGGKKKNGTRRCHSMKSICIKNCSSCGKDHIDLDVHVSDDEGEFSAFDYPWYTHCPETGERVYIREGEL